MESEEVAGLAYKLGRALAGHAEAMVIGHMLVSELTRLRSDEWLERAAEEWARAHDAPSSWRFQADELLAILRKHRDGTA